MGGGGPFIVSGPQIISIAWGMANIGRDIFGRPARVLFGGSEALDEVRLFGHDPDAPETLPPTAEGGLALLEQGYTLWHDGIASLDDDALLRPIGPKGDLFADESMAALVLHLNREAATQGAAICLLLDLYRGGPRRAEPEPYVPLPWEDGVYSSPLPANAGFLLLRTDYSDDAAWSTALEAATAVYPGSEWNVGAALTTLEGPELDGLTPEEIVALPRDADLFVLAVADSQTMRDNTILFMDLSRYSDEIGRTFRAIPEAVETIVVNLEIGNVSFFELADEADADGVFRYA